MKKLVFILIGFLMTSFYLMYPVYAGQRSQSIEDINWQERYLDPNQPLDNYPVAIKAMYVLQESKLIIYSIISDASIFYDNRSKYL